MNTTTLNAKRGLGLIGLVALIGTAAGAHAAITPYQSDGKDLVYSSFSNVTWTKSGNLLGDWMAADGLESVFAALSSVSPTVTVTFGFSGPTVHTLSLSDFREDIGNRGRANFFGAYAFVAYLNSIDYAGTDKWRLPSASNGVYPNPVISSYTKAGDFGQLYYDELGADSGFSVYSGDPLLLSNFTGIQSAQYWSNDPLYLAEVGVTRAFGFNMNDGSQYYLDPAFQFYLMPVTSGLVPEPATFTSLAAGLLALTARRRRHSRSA